MEVSLKIAGVHWWYNSRSHAAEMTAGYYNTEAHDGYAGILEVCAQHGMVATLTCVEMCDAQHPPEALCGPEGLLRQVLPLLKYLLTCENTAAHDGYAGILELCAQHYMVAPLTCVEMCDAQHPPEALYGPEGLLRQMTDAAGLCWQHNTAL